MQKRFAGVLALAFVCALVLAACAVPADMAITPPSAAPAAGTATAGAAAPAEGEGGVINVWTDGDTNISDWLTNKVAPAFEKAYPQYTVKVTTVRGVGNGVADIMQRTGSEADRGRSAGGSL